jgi:hypothetical protein
MTIFWEGVERSKRSNSSAFTELVIAIAKTTAIKPRDFLITAVTHVTRYEPADKNKIRFINRIYRVSRRSNASPAPQEFPSGDF